MELKKYLKQKQKAIPANNALLVALWELKEMVAAQFVKIVALPAVVLNL